jgi:poly(3-hydroxybutyrate) depolymerase
MACRQGSVLRWLLPLGLFASGCGDASWTDWMVLDGSAVIDSGTSTAVSPSGGGDDGGDRGDVRDAAGDAGGADASDGDDGGDASDADTSDADAALPSFDVGAPPDAAPPVDGGNPADAGAPVDIGFDVPVDRGVDVPIDRGNPVDIGFDVPVDRGNPVDIGFDVPVDRGNPVDIGFDVPVDRGNPADIGFDVPVDRGSPVDLGVDVPVDRESPVDVPRDEGPTGPPTSDPVAYAGSFAARTGRFTATLTVRGERRSVVLVVPTNAGASPPLLMVFHGTNGDGAVAMTESNAQALANIMGVVVAAPSSRWRPVGDFDHATEETYWETAPNADIENNQDLVLVRAIMVEAQRAYGVDPTRIYAMGHSNGAFFAHFVAVLLRDRIAAFSENSGGLVRCARTTSCTFQGSGTTCAALRAQAGYCACAGAELPVAVPTSGRMPPGLLTHGTRDPLVSVYYTCTLADLMTARGHTQVTQLFNGEGHGVPSNWAQLVWPFFASRRLGDR